MTVLQSRGGCYANRATGVMAMLLKSFVAPEMHFCGQFFSETAERILRNLIGSKF